MKLKYSNKKIGGFLLALFMLVGVVAVAGTTAQAQWPYGRDRDYRDDRYGRGGYNNNAYQIARQQGYSNGMNVGASDAQRGQSYNPQRSHYWKNGNDGYNSSYGNRGQFKQIFRDAFVQGYREGYQRYAGNRRGNNGRWGNGRYPR